MSETGGKFAGKCCVVTGAASGIGRVTCTEFSRRGAQVVCADINLEGAQATAKACGNGAVAVDLDVTKSSSWQACIEAATEHFGTPPNVLVNCAGVGRNGDFENFPEDDWHVQISVNLTGTYLGCQAAMRVMRPQKNGVIINLSSIAARLGGADIAAYCATKAGVSGLTRAVAMHGAPHGIRVCAIAPTYVDTEMLDNAEIHFPSRDVMLSSMAELIPAGRVAVAEDISNTILMLASDEAAMITGSTIYVDGGQISGMPSRHSE